MLLSTTKKKRRNTAPYIGDAMFSGITTNPHYASTVTKKDNYSPYPLLSLLEQITGTHLSVMRNIKLDSELGFHGEKVFSSGLHLLRWLKSINASELAIDGFDEQITYQNLIAHASHIPSSIAGKYRNIIGKRCN